eukprot:1158132-Pelagomonas_calceolata.AAC.7
MAAPLRLLGCTLDGDAMAALLIRLIGCSRGVNKDEIQWQRNMHLHLNMKGLLLNAPVANMHVARA